MSFRDFELRYLICAIPTFFLLVQFIVLIFLRDRVHKYAYYVFGLVFVPQDVAYNVVCGTLMFKEGPREFLFTTRLKRLDAAEQLPDCTIRFKHVLNEIDPGHV